ncbi:MAG: hypothetical protein AB1631_13750 [Acidobacteriota bacterium]
MIKNGFTKEQNQRMQDGAENTGSKQARYEENASGPFYVEKDMCIICCAPESVAPDLMGFHTDPSGMHEQSHCCFKKQPSTPDELERAIQAISVSCCGALRYEGRDPEILERLRAAGREDACY